MTITIAEYIPAPTLVALLVLRDRLPRCDTAPPAIFRPASPRGTTR